jgi:hypothetical protein
LAPSQSLPFCDAFDFKKNQPKINSNNKKEVEIFLINICKKKKTIETPWLWINVYT